MDKGQHIRLFIVGGTTQSPTNSVIAMSTDLTFHGSMQTELSTTKDDSDAIGAIWDKNEVTGRSYDITGSALIAAGTDSAAKLFNDMLSNVNDVIVNWKIAMASGENNRTMGVVLCSGQAKLTRCEATGQVGNQSTYSYTLNGYGPLVAGTV